MTQTEQTVFTTDEQQRNQAFIDRKQSGESMINRLRDWEVGQIVWGYDSVQETGSTGKTFTREEYGGYGDIEDTDRGHERALQMYEARCEQTSTGPTALFCWVGKIQRVRVEAPDPSDPGEPPLTFAELDAVKVLESTFVPSEEDDE